MTSFTELTAEFLEELLHINKHTSGKVIGLSHARAQKELRAGNFGELAGADPEMLKLFLTLPNVSYSFFSRAVAYYRKHADENYTDRDFAEYLDSVCYGVPIVEAFGELTPDVPLSDEEAEIAAEQALQSLSLEDRLNLPPAYAAELAENALWADERIDIEPDSDNMAYELDELLDKGYFCY